VVCVRDGQILLSRYTRTHEWTLPGGGIDHAEHPYDAAIREAEEETGYRVAIERLLGVDSVDGTSLHMLGIYYEARAVGGDLRYELNGSTDRAEWFDLDDVPGLKRSPILDTGLALWRHRPVDGRARA
jgi:ADP-ribose pyrophosphatase YjhB (NUDIX family)